MLNKIVERILCGDYIKINNKNLYLCLNLMSVVGLKIVVVVVFKFIDSRIFRYIIFYFMLYFCRVVWVFSLEYIYLKC